MKHAMLVYFFSLSFAIEAMAQSIEKSDYMEVVQYAVKVDKQACYRGGQDGVMHYIGKNLRYPEEAMRKGIVGKVLVKFLVGTKGKVKAVEVLRSDNQLLSDEAIRLFKGMAKWTPAYLNDQPVEVPYVLPVTFKLERPEKTSASF
jgi:TonB family protein